MKAVSARKRTDTILDHDWAAAIHADILAQGNVPIWVITHWVTAGSTTYQARIVHLVGLPGFGDSGLVETDYILLSNSLRALRGLLPSGMDRRPEPWSAGDTSTVIETWC